MIYRIFGPEESQFDESIVTLMNECLGPEYYSRVKLGIRRQRGFVCVAFDEFLPVGVTTAYVMDDVEVAALIPAEDDWRQKLLGSTTVLLESSAVRPGYRGRGIGKRLFELRLDWAMRDKDADYAVALAWRSGANESIGLHLALGGKVIYEGGHSFEGVPCVRCAPADCTCVGDIVLFEKQHEHEWDIVNDENGVGTGYVLCWCGSTYVIPTALSEE